MPRWAWALASVLVGMIVFALILRVHPGWDVVTYSGGDPWGLVFSSLGRASAPVLVATVWATLQKVVVRSSSFFVGWMVTFWIALSVLGSLNFMAARFERAHAPVATPGGTYRLDAASRLVAEAEAAQPSLPMRVDDMTTLRAVTSQGGELIYTYEVDTDLAFLSPGLKDSVAALVCQGAPSRALLDAGGLLTFRYQNLQDRPLLRFTVTQADCASP